MKQVKLPMAIIDEIFENSTSQMEYITSLYRVVFSNWSDIKEIFGYPKISERTSEYIFKKAMVFDSENHPKTLNGGLWMNKGFGIDEKVKKDWMVYLTKVSILLK